MQRKDSTLLFGVFVIGCLFWWLSSTSSSYPLSLSSCSLGVNRNALVMPARQAPRECVDRPSFVCCVLLSLFRFIASSYPLHTHSSSLETLFCSHLTLFHFQCVPFGIVCVFFSLSLFRFVSGFFFLTHDIYFRIFPLFLHYRSEWKSNMKM